MEIPGFEQVEKVVENGFASYWKAYQRSLDRHVTLVVLRPDAVSDEGVRRAFLRDIRILAGLKHQSLFQVYDVMELDAALVVTVEHLSGQTLRHYMRAKGRLKGEKALTIARWVAEGLNHVHEKTGLLHLALTPDQVWINGDGEVRILGFGFSAIFNHIGYSPADVPFLSPEQVRHRDGLDTRSDLYSLGSILYYMLTGRVPFEGNSPQQMLDLIGNGQLPSPAVEGGSLALHQVLSRMQMKDPDDRYPDWPPAMQEMDKVLDGARFLSGPKRGGVSTILPPSSAGRGSAAAKTPSGARPAAGAKAAPEVSSPGSILATILVLGTVLGFWAWLGLNLWRMPPPAPEESSVMQAAPAAGPNGSALPPGETAEDSRPGSRVRVIRQSSTGAVPPPVASDVPPPVTTDSTAAVTSLPPAVAEAGPAAPADPYDKLVDEVARHVLAGRQDRAMGAVEGAIRKNDPALRGVRLEELRALLQRSADPSALVMAAVKQQVGQKLKLPVHGRYVEVTVVRMEGPAIVVSESVQSENLPARKFYTLEPLKMGLAEQVRLLALESAPEFGVAQVLLCLKGGAKERASAAAAAAGVLGPAFQRQLAEARP